MNTLISFRIHFITQKIVKLIYKAKFAYLKIYIFKSTQRLINVLRFLLIMIRQAATRPFTQILRCKCKHINNICSISTTPLVSLSSRDIFFRDIPAELAAQVPPLPSPLKPPPTIAELITSGESLLENFGLWSWWKPTGWVRYFYEFVHTNTDLPWFATISVCAAAIRLAFVFVPLKIQRTTARQLKYQDETNAFMDRMQEARFEGNYLLVQQVLMEQREFNKKKGINTFILPWIMFNGGVFMTQFLSIRGMVNAKFPGFSDGGFLWATDLTISDPYYILPVVNAFLMHFAFKTGLESGSSDVLPPVMRAGLLYGAPLVMVITAGFMPSAITIYWMTNSVLTLIFAGVFKSDIGRRVLNLPKPQKIEKQALITDMSESFKKFSTNFSGQQKAFNLSSIRKDDIEQFKRAGRTKPIIDMEEEESKTTTAVRQSKQR